MGALPIKDGSDAIYSLRYGSHEVALIPMTRAHFNDHTESGIQLKKQFIRVRNDPSIRYNYMRSAEYSLEEIPPPMYTEKDLEALLDTIDAAQYASLAEYFTQCEAFLDDEEAVHQFMHRGSGPQLQRDGAARGIRIHSLRHHGTGRATAPDDDAHGKQTSGEDRVGPGPQGGGSSVVTDTRTLTTCASSRESSSTAATGTTADGESTSNASHEKTGSRQSTPASSLTPPSVDRADGEVASRGEGEGSQNTVETSSGSRSTRSSASSYVVTVERMHSGFGQVERDVHDLQRDPDDDSSAPASATSGTDTASSLPSPPVFLNAEGKPFTAERQAEIDEKMRNFKRAMRPLPCAVAFVYLKNRETPDCFPFLGRKINVIGFFGCRTHEDDSDDTVPHLQVRRAILKAAGDRTLERVIGLACKLFTDQFFQAATRHFGNFHGYNDKVAKRQKAFKDRFLHSLRTSRLRQFRTPSSSTPSSSSADSEEKRRRTALAAFEAGLPLPVDIDVEEMQLCFPAPRTEVTNPLELFYAYAEHISLFVSAAWNNYQTLKFLHDTAALCWAAAKELPVNENPPTFAFYEREKGGGKGLIFMFDGRLLGRGWVWFSTLVRLVAQRGCWVQFVLNDLAQRKDRLIADWLANDPRAQRFLGNASFTKKLVEHLNLLHGEIVRARETPTEDTTLWAPQQELSYDGKVYGIFRSPTCGPFLTTIKSAATGPNATAPVYKSGGGSQTKDRNRNGSGHASASAASTLTPAATATATAASGLTDGTTPGDGEGRRKKKRSGSGINGPTAEQQQQQQQCGGNMDRKGGSHPRNGASAAGIAMGQHANWNSVPPPPPFPHPPSLQDSGGIHGNGFLCSVPNYHSDSNRNRPQRSSADNMNHTSQNSNNALFWQPPAPFTAGAVPLPGFPHQPHLHPALANFSGGPSATSEQIQFLASQYLQDQLNRALLEQQHQHLQQQQRQQQQQQQMASLPTAAGFDIRSLFPAIVSGPPPPFAPANRATAAPVATPDNASTPSSNSLQSPPLPLFTPQQQQQPLPLLNANAAMQPPPFMGGEAPALGVPVGALPGSVVGGGLDLALAAALLRGGSGVAGTAQQQRQQQQPEASSASDNHPIRGGDLPLGAPGLPLPTSMYPGAAQQQLGGGDGGGLGIDSSYLLQLLQGNGGGTWNSNSNNNSNNNSSSNQNVHYDAASLSLSSDDSISNTGGVTEHNTSHNKSTSNNHQSQYTLLNALLASMQNGSSSGGGGGIGASSAMGNMLHAELLKSQPPTLFPANSNSNTNSANDMLAWSRLLSCGGGNAIFPSPPSSTPPIPHAQPQPQQQQQQQQQLQYILLPDGRIATILNP